MAKSKEPLPAKLLDYMLADLEGFDFETLVTRLLSFRHGKQFESLGGNKDGGADGLLRGVYTLDGKHYVQVSRESKIDSKIRKTVDALKKAGRTPTAVTYWTHRKAPKRDIIEEEISSETGLIIRVRERSSLHELVNESEESITFFRDKFRKELDDLLGGAKPASKVISQFVEDPSVYAYLKFEVGERTDRSALLPPVVDALIYWALRETDPDAGRLMSRQQLKDRIADALPGARNQIIPLVDERLGKLSAKSNAGERVRAYLAKDAFCLPYEMRLTLETESAGDLSLTKDVLQSLTTRAEAEGAGEQSELVGMITLDVVYRHFHEQGLVLAAFLEKRLELIHSEEQVLERELNRTLDAENVSPKSYDAALSVLRGFFYEPTDVELKFQKSLSKTSLLLFSLKHSPQLLEYFNGMAGTFRLLIGSDIIVKALSEFYLDERARTVTNLLRAAREAGAKLILAEPVVTEVYTHLHAAQMEFKNHFAAREHLINSKIASQSDRILIRAYFYARGKQAVKSWKAYVENFVDFDPLNSADPRGQDQLRAFLSKRFGFDYMPDDVLWEGIDATEVSLLAEQLVQRSAKRSAPMESRAALAKNDALLAHAVYAQRGLNHEVAKYDGYGLATWWLTKETGILAFTGELVRKNGTPYVMRPEFLLNFLTLSPKAKLTEKAQELLPTHVGLQLGKHLSSNQMEKLLAAVEEWRDLPPERREIRLSEFSDRLKFDRLKRYGSNIDLDSGDVFREGFAALEKSLAADGLELGAVPQKPADVTAVLPQPK